MTLILETGAGVRLANSCVTASYVDSYLAARGRETENSWDVLSDNQKEEFSIQATDYVETRFASKFLGAREFYFDMVLATGSIVFAGLPTDTETFLLGDETYTFVTTLTGSENEILIGSDAADTALNVSYALADDSTYEGVKYGTDTIANRHATGTVDGATVSLIASAPGDSGNDTIFSGTVTNTTITAFASGEDGGSQPLSFPRLYLYDWSGNEVDGIPRKLKEAICEYTIRAAAGLLLPDPTTDDHGGTLKQVTEKVGPIESTTIWNPGTMGTQLLKPYPAADRLLREYLPTGGVIR